MASRLFDWISKLDFRQIVTLAVVVALIMFALASFSIWMLLQHEAENSSKENDVPTTQVVPQIVMRKVVVANVTIAPKTILKTEMLTVKDFLEDSVPPDAFNDISQLVGKPTKVVINANEVITAQKIFDNVNQVGFVGTIPPDCRAVSINVNDVTGVAGFAKPGDRVDVMLVERNDGVATTSVLLQDVLLLSINQNMGVNKNAEENSATTAIANPSLATLALRPDEAMKLISASKIGEIYLMLRPFQAWTEYAAGDEYTMKSIKAKTAETPAPVEEKKEEPKKEEKKEEPAKVEQPKIEILYGDSLEKETEKKFTRNNSSNEDNPESNPESKLAGRRTTEEFFVEVTP